MQCASTLFPANVTALNLVDLVVNNVSTTQGQTKHSEAMFSGYFHKKLQKKNCKIKNVDILVINDNF